MNSWQKQRENCLANQLPYMGLGSSEDTIPQTLEGCPRSCPWDTTGLCGLSLALASWLFPPSAFPCSVRGGGDSLRGWRRKGAEDQVLGGGKTQGSLGWK